MNLLGYASYAAARQGFRWDERWSLFEGNREYFNLANECLDRHIRAGKADVVGARIIHADGVREICTFGDLDRSATKIALLLQSQGVERGDAVAVRLEPSTEFIAAMFGILRLGAVFVPCTPLLGTDAIVSRITDAKPKVTLLESDDDLGGYRPQGAVLDRARLLAGMARQTGAIATARTRAEDPAIYIYSSGTTGRPKRTILQHQGFTYLTVIVGQFVLGLEPSDRYIACYTPGYLGGFGWGILMPMALGTAAGIYAGKFDPAALLNALSELEVTALHCPPTAYRKLIRAYAGQPLSLRKLAYTAEAMDADLARLIKTKFGIHARGHYGATEVGMIAIDYAFPDYEVRPGAIGQPLLGTEVVVVDAEEKCLGPGEVGRVALIRNGKTMFSGDFGAWDKDGYLWYKGRVNDVIISAGHTISAEEIEETLRKHSAVDQVAVVAKADPERGSIAKAFVRLMHPEQAAAPAQREALVAELQDLVRERLGRYAYPREIVFVDDFQRNEAGKIVKAALRDQ